MSNQNAGTITVYGRTANGDTAPTRTLSTPGLGISGGMFVDAVNSELVELNRNSNTVYVFGETASGNTAATRTLAGASTGITTPVGVVVDAINNELFVANNGNNSVTVYARTASGNTAPTRTLSGASTGLSALAGIAVDTVNNELFSANNNLSVTVYGRTASGNTAPTRTLNVGAATGPNHALGGVFVDTVNNELFVSAFDSPASANASILVYSRTASGNAAPIRTLAGASTGLSFPLGVIVDTVNNELLVADQGVPSITVYPRTASGNTAPTRTLSGASTGLSEPAYLAVTTGAAPPPSVSTTTLASSVNPSSSGQAVTFTASVSGSAGTPTGTVTFLDGAATIGSGTLNASGVATLTTSTLTVGAHPITAQYAGNGSYAGSTSNLVNQTVDAVLLTSSTLLATSATTAAPGQAITFTASVSGSAGTPGGVVTFHDGAAAIGNGTLDAGGTATLTLATLAPGVHTISAAYAGDAVYSGSTSNSVVVTVAPVAVTPAVSAPALSPAAQWALAWCCLLAGAYVARRRGLAASRPQASLWVIAALLLVGTSTARADDIAPAARTMIATVDALDVEHHWPAGVHVHWQSGEPDGKPESATGKHTHCSAFVAAAAKRLGIYILRPPEHAQTLLANAQFDWLAGEGASRGWRPLRDAAEAQAQANRGLFVVAAYKNRRDDKPGHIAIVRPGMKSSAALASEGPDITQAGGRNYRLATLAQGFAGHPAAWRDREVRFYAHAAESPR